MQVDSPFGRIFHWMKKRGRNPKSAPKGAKPRADQSGTIRAPFQVLSCCPCRMGSILPGAKTEGTCFASPPKIPSATKEKPPDWMVSNWSRLRGSNSLPPPWQGGALPDELNLRFSQRCLLYRMEALLSRTFFFKSETPAKFAAPARPPFCFGQTPGNLLRLSPQNLFGDKKEKPPKIGWLLWRRLRAKRRRRFQVPSCCPYRMGSILPGQKPRELASPLSPKIPWAAKKKNHPKLGGCFGAGYEARTRYLHLGKVALYQMS